MINLLVISLKLCVLSILLSLNTCLALLKRKLSLALERLVWRVVLLLSWGRIFTDLLMNLLVKLLKSISLYSSLDVGSKLLLVLLVIFLLKVLHVLSNVSSEDTLTVHICVVLLSITVVSWETLLRVWDIKSTISSSLKCSEDTASSGSCTASNIKKSTEWALLVINLINVVGLLSYLSLYNLSINLSVSLINIIKANLLEKTSCYKKSGTVSCSVVLKTNLKSVTFKLSRVSCSKDTVTIDERVSNLANYVLVGETYNKTVLWRLVLVLCLDTKLLTLTVVGTSLTTTTKLNLVTAEVSLALLNLGELY